MVEPGLDQIRTQGAHQAAQLEENPWTYATRPGPQCMHLDPKFVERWAKAPRFDHRNDDGIEPRSVNHLHQPEEHGFRTTSLEVVDDVDETVFHD